ncbi:hypothetical protein CH92_21355 [Stutzerimonas stutzeri]|uniref:Uncharacterized protein n=1 Tax=Stutzerimonas stutzeri TaxID=316 RepID=W8RZW3_STUST|nr:hypothetical protein CH92_21355 [Stutzerimonas stutzeri]
MACKKPFLYIGLEPMTVRLLGLSVTMVNASAGWLVQLERWQIPSAIKLNQGTRWCVWLGRDGATPGLMSLLISPVIMAG